MTRIKREVTYIFENQNLHPDICLLPDEDNVTKLRAIIIGPKNTPYEGGFFEFFIRCGPQYPITPPRVKFLTTNIDTIRFNPNLYANGKVCLSILGTWPGPSWTPALGLDTLLVSIQSILNDKPYCRLF